MPARTVQGRLHVGQLHLVPDAPRFPYPAWVVWRDDIPDDLAATAARTLRDVAERADTAQGEVLEGLAQRSEEGTVATLGAAS